MKPELEELIKKTIAEEAQKELYDFINSRLEDFIDSEEIENELYRGVINTLKEKL